MSIRVWFLNIILSLAANWTALMTKIYMTSSIRMCLFHYLKGTSSIRIKHILNDLSINWHPFLLCKHYLTSEDNQAGLMTKNVTSNIRIWYIFLFKGTSSIRI